MRKERRREPRLPRLNTSEMALTPSLPPSLSSLDHSLPYCPVSLTPSLTSLHPPAFSPPSLLLFPLPLSHLSPLPFLTPPSLPSLPLSCCSFPPTSPLSPSLSSLSPSLPPSRPAAVRGCSWFPWRCSTSVPRLSERGCFINYADERGDGSTPPDIYLICGSSVFVGPWCQTEPGPFSTCRLLQPRPDAAAAPAR